MPSLKKLLTGFLLNDLLAIPRWYIFETVFSILRKFSTYYFPLADLEVVDKNSANSAPVLAYVVWFANR